VLVQRRFLVVVAAAAVSSAPAIAHAQEKQDATTAFDGQPQRRAGIVIGIAAGGGLVGASGYPNNATKIDDPAYYASSGVMGGTGGSLFVMGALADYVNFGFWFGTQNAQNGDWKSHGAAGGFRVEGFPLYSLFPALRDLALFSQLGIGSATLDAKRGDYPGADGVQSFIGAGAFYEWCIGKALGGHFAFGPSAEYDAIFSRSIERHGALFGARVVWYGGK
jgi:hypothetical protein